MAPEDAALMRLLTRTVADMERERDAEMLRLHAVADAARALCAELTTDCLPRAGTRWQEARALREALAALDGAP